VIVWEVKSWYENDGNENFIPHTITTGADATESVYAIDVDGDGDIDVLSASGGDNKIAWYENDGNENFNPHIITTDADEPRSVYAIDVDGDGDIDVLSASFFDDKIAWYKNDGNENFTPDTITTSTDGAISVYAVDVDGDGDMDVLSASANDAKIAWYENDGNENFTPHTIATDALDARSVYAIDVDGDGDIDVLSASVFDDKIAWYENDGNENFTPHTITTSTDGAISVYAVDVDGDGDMDVLSASANDHKIAWYENLMVMPPMAYYSAEPTSGKVPLIVQFTDSSTGTITDWLWDFGDDSTSTEQNPTHTYSVADTFTVSLSVSGPGGNNTLIQENYIIVIDPTLIRELSDVLPTKFKLYNNYPNPFNPSTIIRFSIPEESIVTIKVFNTLGEEITTLINENIIAGNYEVEFDASKLPSGIYFYKLQAGSFVETKNMDLLQ